MITSSYWCANLLQATTNDTHKTAANKRDKHRQPTQNRLTDLRHSPKHAKKSTMKMQHQKSRRTRRATIVRRNDIKGKEEDDGTATQARERERVHPCCNTAKISLPCFASVQGETISNSLEVTARQSDARNDGLEVGRGRPDKHNTNTTAYTIRRTPQGKTHEESQYCNNEIVQTRMMWNDM